MTLTPGAQIDATLADHETRIAKLEALAQPVVVTPPVVTPPPPVVIPPVVVPPVVTLLTTRTLTNTGTTPIAAGTMCEPFGVAFRRGDVPAGHSVTAKLLSPLGVRSDASLQISSRTYWEVDGSLRWGEVHCYSPVTIAPREAWPIEFYATAGAFNDSLPAGKTAAQLISDLAAYDLKLALTGVATVAGVASGSGAYVGAVNALLAGPNVQLTDAGPCFARWKVYGPFVDAVGGAPHPDLRADFFVGLWLHADGSIACVECAFDVLNGEIAPAMGPNRYNYAASLDSGAAVLQSWTINPGTAATYGGHHARGRWGTYDTDGRPVLASATAIVPRPALEITLSPSAVTYLMDTGMVPRLDLALAPSIANTGDRTTCTPFHKGYYSAGNPLDYGYADQMVINGGGEHNYIGPIALWSAEALLTQRLGCIRDVRRMAVDVGGAPWNWQAPNGRIVPLCAGTFGGLATAQPATYTFDPSIKYVAGITPPADISTFGLGGWEAHYGGAPASRTDCTHFPDAVYYAYILFGGRHLLERLYTLAQFVIMCKIPFPSSGSQSGLRNRSGGGLKGSYTGIVIQDWAIRGEAWALRAIGQAAAIAPAGGERDYFRQVIAQNTAFLADHLANVATPNEVALGAYWNSGFISGANKALPSGARSGFMVDYLAFVWAQMSLWFWDDPALGAGVVLGRDQLRKWCVGYFNIASSYFASAYTMYLRQGLNEDFLPSWGACLQYNEDVNTTPVLATAWDSAGWITYGPTPKYTWQVGDTIQITRDHFSDISGLQPAPPVEIPLTAGQMSVSQYQITQADPANKRIKIKPIGGAEIGAYSSSPAGAYLLIAASVAGPATGYLGYEVGASYMAYMLAAARTQKRALTFAGQADPALDTAIAGLAARFATGASSSQVANAKWAVLP